MLTILERLYLDRYLLATQKILPSKGRWLDTEIESFIPYSVRTSLPISELTRHTSQHHKPSFIIFVLFPYQCNPEILADKAISERTPRPKLID